MKIKVKVHTEGYFIILIASLLTVGGCFAIRHFLGEYSFLCETLYIILIGILLMVILFFRYPDRWMEKDENAIYAPADGKIVAIEEISENKYSNETRIQVSIFMSPVNMHVNFYPITGKIKMKDYYPGDKRVAWHPKSSELNEHSVVWIENERNSDKNVIVKQIAGAMARRIVCHAQEGTSVEQGDELGIIKFGSRVDILLPSNAYINVDFHQKVKAKKTILAYFD